MQNSEIAKTKWAPKRWLGWGLLIAALLAVMIAAVLSKQTPEMRVRVGGQTYTLTRATTKAQKEQGLSRTRSLAHDRGMFFWNTHNTKVCFWMKAMHYSLDIIWLDSFKKVTHIESDVAPGTYPHTFCHFGQYVIELNSGEVAKNGLRVGQTVRF